MGCPVSVSNPHQHLVALSFWQWLVTRKAYEQWEKYKLMLAGTITTPDRNNVTDAPMMNGVDEESRDDVVLATVRTVVLDTVGAVCVDRDGNIGVGASSGGIAMKVRYEILMELLSANLIILNLLDESSCVIAHRGDFHSLSRVFLS